jgi:hypothetical protein
VRDEPTAYILPPTKLPAVPEPKIALRSVAYIFLRMKFTKDTLASSMFPVLKH